MLGIGKARRLPTVLLIDDDMVSREVTATVLTMSGYTVHTASNAAEAISLLDSKTCTPHVILTDAQMPGLSGSELVRELRARSAGMLYAISGSEIPPEMLRQVDGFLLKPFGPEALEELIEKDVAIGHAAPPAGLAAINPRTIADFRGMMSETAVREIYAAVSADLERRYTAVELAIEHGDRVEIHRIGHSIKGGCGMAGALEAAHIGELLESGGDDLEYSRSLLPHFQTVIGNLKRMLDAEFSAQNGNPAG
ncbi:MAG TPA: response regulator [Terracidiphilus sp.]|jgi:CheY-like chemotaxis protein|nr:response regulator [Terracidiphilus sp.]